VAGVVSGPEPTYEVLSPEPRYVEPPADFTVGIADLNGRSVAQLWDGLFRGDELLAIISDALRSRFPRVRIVDHAAFGVTHGPDEARLREHLPEMLRQADCDLAISGLGG
jgi:hypothetical protein